MPLNMCTATIQELMTPLSQDLTYESADRLVSVLQSNPLRSPQQLEIFSGYPAEAWRRLLIDDIITFSSTSVPNHPSPNKDGSGSDISYTSTPVNSPSNSTSGKKIIEVQALICQMTSLRHTCHLNCLLRPKCKTFHTKILVLPLVL